MQTLRSTDQGSLTGLRRAEAHRIGALKLRTQGCLEGLTSHPHRGNPWFPVFSQPTSPGSPVCTPEGRGQSACAGTQRRAETGAASAPPPPCSDRSLFPESVKTGRNAPGASLNKQSTEQSKLQCTKPQHITIDSNTRQSSPLPCLQAPSQSRSPTSSTGTPVPQTAEALGSCTGQSCLGSRLCLPEPPQVPRGSPLGGHPYTQLLWR